jgi:hypothetical protein
VIVNEPETVKSPRQGSGEPQVHREEFEVWLNGSLPDDENRFRYGHGPLACVMVCVMVRDGVRVRVRWSHEIDGLIATNRARAWNDQWSTVTLSIVVDDKATPTSRTSHIPFVDIREQGNLLYSVPISQVFTVSDSTRYFVIQSLSGESHSPLQ